MRNKQLKRQKTFQLTFYTKEREDQYLDVLTSMSNITQRICVIIVTIEKENQRWPTLAGIPTSLIILVVCAKIAILLNIIKKRRNKRLPSMNNIWYRKMIPLKLANRIVIRYLRSKSRLNLDATRRKIATPK